jgi:hypothetical protein
MTLNSTGLGVGGSPSYKIHSVVTSGFAGKFNSSTAVAGGILAGNSIADLIVGVDASGNGRLTADTSKYLGLGSGGINDRVILDSSGNVGIGVTPSAWGSNSKVLQVGSGSGAVSSTGAGSTSTRFTHGCYFDNTNWKHQFAGVGPSLYELTGSNAGSTHAWYIAAGGTVNTNIAFTQAMTLDASGNLLVGVASNPNTARAYFRYDTLTIQPVINSASIVAASTSWNHFVGQSGNGSTVTTNNVFIRGNGDIVNANGVYGTISDLRLKENISDARNYLSDLLKLRVVNYSLKEEASAVANKLGFIAQEVEQVFPKMVDTDKEDTKSIKISVLIPMLVKAIQELTARVQTLEAK